MTYKALLNADRRIEDTVATRKLSSERWKPSFDECNLIVTKALRA